MTNKELLLNLLNNASFVTCHDDVDSIEDKDVTDISENHFRVETIRPATDAEKAKYGPNVPDSRIMSEWLLLTDDEAANPPSGDPCDIIKGGVQTQDKTLKAYRII